MTDHFRTILHLDARPNQIDYNSRILVLGSCFAENIGQKLDYFKFQSLQNPFGILFHPLAIENLIGRSVNDTFFNKDDLFYHHGLWQSFEAHSSLSHQSVDHVLNQLNNAVKAAKRELLNASHIIITLGSAWVYRHIESDFLVANCHKVAQKEFLKELLPVAKIQESLEVLCANIKKLNPEADIIFTISPVRHLKDGFVENQRSKAHLITAVHEYIDSHKQISYFPSYELMMDDLRDYRFYKEDMLHPNSTSINYIWGRFKEVWISESAKQIMGEVDKICKAMAHKSFNPESKQHQDFLKKLEISKKNLSMRYPTINFE